MTISTIFPELQAVTGATTGLRSARNNGDRQQTIGSLLETGEGS
jgi:hypothetical protein